MAQKEWLLLSETDGSVLASVVCDTSMSGASIETAGVWHSPELLNRYATMLLQAETWLRDQGVGN